MEGPEVVLRMSAQEAELLSFALRAGFETTSRAEYWIRHGVAQPSVRAFSGAVYEVATAECESSEVLLDLASRRRRTRDDPVRPHSHVARSLRDPRSCR